MRREYIFITENPFSLMPAYGNYCSTSNANAAEPVDALDRACQIYNLCTIARAQPCFCTQQLYSNIIASNSVNNEYKDAMISNILTVLYACPDSSYIFTQYYIPAYNGNQSRGYTYLPIYAGNEHQAISFNYVSGVQAYISCKTTFFRYFVHAAYRSPESIISTVETTSGGLIKRIFLQGIIYVPPHSVLILINSNITQTAVVNFNIIDGNINSSLRTLERQRDKLIDKLFALNKEYHDKLIAYRDSLAQCKIVSFLFFIILMISLYIVMLFILKKNDPPRAPQPSQQKTTGQK